MRIALTHNLQLTDSEEEAEFDRPETIAALCEAIQSLGHEVEPVEVSGPASRTVARLEALSPDLVFNTAEGRRGRFREAFYPALFDELGMPYTGSDAYVCAVTLDKQLTKTMLASHGIPTARGAFVTDVRKLSELNLRFPLIVKPNFEGSSKGITQDSVVDNAKELRARVHDVLQSYAAGVLIEEFIAGRDIAVPFIETASRTTGGVLPPAEYRFDSAAMVGRKHRIYDYYLKQVASDAVSVHVPADVSPKIAEALQGYSSRVMKVVGLRDLGRIDYRLGDDGQLYFIEINALPSLEPGAAIYLSAAHVGLKEPAAVLDAVIRSATARYGVFERSQSIRSKRKALQVGLAFNLKRVTPQQDGRNDTEAEYDSPSTIQAIRRAIESYGHEVIELEATPDFPTALSTTQVDIVFNIAEGLRGRHREAQVPAILELMDIPYTGSDPAALTLTLDKALAKRVVAQAGVLTPEFVVMVTGKERLPKTFPFPAVVKPLAEGSSKGIVGTSVVRDERELRHIVRDVAGKYGQPALVESYLEGREFTVALLGERRPRVLPPMEIVFVHPERCKVYSFEHKLNWTEDIRYDAPAKLDGSLERELERVAKTVFSALGCRDVARIDLRLDGAGRVNFVECNPLPGLTPDWSDLCLIAKSAGMDYRTLIGEILSPAIRRFRERERRKKHDKLTTAG